MKNAKYANIEAERARNGLTIDQFAAMMGISRRTYYIYQRRGNIPTTKLIAMAELFNCSIDYLLGRSVV